MKHPCIQYWYLCMYNIYAYICSLYHLYVILRYFLDLGLKIEDSFKTENIATSTLIITEWILIMFHRVFFAFGQITDFPWGQQGWKQGSLQKSILRSILCYFNELLYSWNKKLLKLIYPSTNFFIVHYKQAWTGEIARMQLVIERAPGLHNNGDSN